MKDINVAMFGTVLCPSTQTQNTFVSSSPPIKRHARYKERSLPGSGLRPGPGARLGSGAGAVGAILRSSWRVAGRLHRASGTHTPRAGLLHNPNQMNTTEPEREPPMHQVMTPNLLLTNHVDKQTC